MANFILFMHNDATRPGKPEDWDRYISLLRAGKHFVGGSAIGAGVTIKGDAVSDKITPNIGGYMVIHARDIEEAKQLVQENPVRQAGGTVEVRDLPRT